jgi:aryl-alcohol dehydrogenase-like predicted oxidoreductase
MGVTAKFGARMPETKAVALLNTVYRLGSTHFDTAHEQDINGNPFSRRLHEVIVGRFVGRLPRTSFTVATKFTAEKHEGKQDAKTVADAVEASLGRLGLTSIDLYYLNRPASLEAVVEFMNSIRPLVDEGKVKHVGLSDVFQTIDPEWIRAAHAIVPLSAIQQEWSLVHRDCEEKVVPVCAELKIGIVAFSPLARKLFTASRGLSPEQMAQNQKIAEQLEKVASTRRGVTAPQVTLAWVYRQASRLNVSVMCIPGTSKVPHATANVQSVRIPLNDNEMAFIEGPHEITTD